MYRSLILILLFTGCAFAPRYKGILTSEEVIYIIPQGTEFISLQDDKEVKTTAIRDLVALTKGKYLSLEQEANRRALKEARVAKRRGVIWGALGSIFSFLGILFGKAKLGKKKKKK